MGAQTSTEGEAEGPPSNFFNSPSSYMQEGSSSWMTGGGARVVSSRLRWGGSSELKKPVASDSDDEPVQGSEENLDASPGEDPPPGLRAHLVHLHQRNQQGDEVEVHATGESFPIASETVLLSESGAHIFGKSAVPEREKPWARFSLQSSEVPSNPPESSEEPPAAVAPIATSCSCSSTSSQLSSTDPGSAPPCSEPTTSAPTSFSDPSTCEGAPAPLTISTSTSPTITPLTTPACATNLPPTKLSPIITGIQGSLSTTVPVLTPPPVSSTSLSWKLQGLHDPKGSRPTATTPSRLQASATEAGRAGVRGGAAAAQPETQKPQKVPENLESSDKTPKNLERSDPDAQNVQTPERISTTKRVPSPTSASPIHGATDREGRWSRPVSSQASPRLMTTKGGRPCLPAAEKQATTTAGQQPGSPKRSENSSQSPHHPSMLSAESPRDCHAAPSEAPARPSRQAGCWVPKWLPQADMEAEPELLAPNEEQPMLEDTSRAQEPSHDLVLYEVVEHPHIESNETTIAQERTRLRLHAQMHRCRARTGSDQSLQGSDAQTLLRRQQSQLLEERRRLEEERRNLADARKRQAEVEAKLELEREMIRKEWEKIAAAKAKLGLDEPVDAEHEETCL